MHSRSKLAVSSIPIRTLALAACFMGASGLGTLRAQIPCADTETFATGLLAPSKIIQTPRGNFLVAENGPETPNNGRISFVDRCGRRRTLLAGLPSARTFVGDFNGTTGLYLEGRTLFVLNGQGDVTLAGGPPGTEVANPSPSSPLFSSVLAVDFTVPVDETTVEIGLTLTDHDALKRGEVLRRRGDGGQEVRVRLITDFDDVNDRRLRTRAL